MLGFHLGQPDELDQRPFSRADIGAATTFETLKNTELAGVLRFTRFNMDGDLFGLKTHRTHFQAPAAANTL